jgi:hypothetical protein
MPNAGPHKRRRSCAPRPSDRQSAPESFKIRSAIADKLTTDALLSMKPARQAISLPRPFPAATLVATIIFAGCGAASPSGQRSAYAPPIANSGLAESAVQGLKAPHDFRLATCEVLTQRAYTRCYRRNTYAPLNPVMFAAIIAASGLAPESGTVVCPHILRSRRDNHVRWDHCEARASATSVEFTAFATSIKILRQSAIKPSDRALMAKMRGTVFELSVVATNGPHA